MNKPSTDRSTCGYLLSLVVDVGQLFQIGGHKGRWQTEFAANIRARAAKCWIGC